MHNIILRSLLHLLLLARAHLARNQEAQPALGPLLSVHTDLSSCVEEEIVWDEPVFWEEAVALLVSQVVICSGCEISFSSFLSQEGDQELGSTSLTQAPGALSQLPHFSQRCHGAESQSVQ